MKIFNFSWHISVFFSFPPGDMAKYFQISKFIFTFFPFPSGGMDKIFSKFKTKFFNSNFENVSFQIFLVAQTIFFLDPSLPNLLKDCKKYLFILTKIVI
jgi:hypothetical protein